MSRREKVEIARLEDGVLANTTVLMNVIYALGRARRVVEVEWVGASGDKKAGLSFRAVVPLPPDAKAVIDSAAKKGRRS